MKLRGKALQAAGEQMRQRMIAAADERFQLRVDQPDAHVDAWRHIQFLKKMYAQFDARHEAVERETARMLETGR